MKKNSEELNEKIKKIETSLDDLNSKKNKFLFCVPDIHSPSALIYEIYFHATVLEEMGYEVIMLTDQENFTPPDYIEDELVNKTHQHMSGGKLKVGPQDFMIIPEIFTNVMEQTKTLPCKRIVLLQSIDYMLNALIPGSNWRDFDIKSVITTSETLKDFLELFYEKDFYDIDTYNIGIPDYFSQGDKPKKPIISIIGRNPNEMTKIVKLFYTKFPQYRWITFDTMMSNSNPPKPVSRKEFSKKLKDNFAAVWIDRISSFGTFPLECMKTNTIPICLKPDITPDYLIDKKSKDFKAVDNLGIWTKDFYDIPLLIGNLVTKFLDDSIPENIYKTMKKVSSKYNQKNSKEELIKIYNKQIDIRKKLFENILKKDMSNE